MLNIGAIKDTITSGKGSGKLGLLIKLPLNGFTPTEIIALSSIIDELISVTPDEAKIQSEYDRIQKFSETNYKQVTIQANQAIREKIDTNNMSTHVPYNSKKVFSLVEPLASDPHFTEPTDIEPANYSILHDYPNSSGSVDENMNWFKVNKTKNSVEVVHSSRTQFKIDRDGNLTMYVTGNFKEIIMGDHYYECRGNSDIVINGNTYRHISGESVNRYDLNKVDEIALSNNITIGEDRTTQVGSNDTTVVDSDSTITSGGNFTNTAEGDATLKAGKVVSNSSSTTNISSSGSTTLKGSNIHFNQ